MEYLICGLGKSKGCVDTGNPNSANFVSTAFNISKEDALKYIKENNKSPFYKENFISNEEYKASQKRDLDYYINKYGISKGTIMYEEYMTKLKYSHSEKFYIDKFGEIDGKEHWKKLNNKKDSMSYNFFLSKYKNHDIALSKYNERKNGVIFNINKYVLKHGLVNGTHIYNTIRKTRREKFITTLRENLKNKDTYSSQTTSKEANKFFDELVKLLIKNKIITDETDVIYKTKEKAIYNKKTKGCFFYDFNIISKKILIEYNGIKYHPKKLNDLDFKFPFYKMSIEEINEKYMYDQQKIKTANNYGYDTIVVWSDDNNKLENTLFNIKKLIKNKE